MGCGVWGVGCGVWGVGFQVSGLGFGVSGFGYTGEKRANATKIAYSCRYFTNTTSAELPGPGCRVHSIQGPGFRVQGLGFRAQGLGLRG